MQKVFVTLALMVLFVGVAPLANAATSAPAHVQVIAADPIAPQGGVLGDLLADIEGLLGDLGVA
jgi:hypothetical protein